MQYEDIPQSDTYKTFNHKYNHLDDGEATKE